MILPVQLARAAAVVAAALAAGALSSCSSAIAPNSTNLDPAFLPTHPNSFCADWNTPSAFFGIAPILNTEKVITVDSIEFIGATNLEIGTEKIFPALDGHTYFLEKQPVNEALAKNWAAGTSLAGSTFSASDQIGALVTVPNPDLLAGVSDVKVHYSMSGERFTHDESISLRMGGGCD